MQLNIDFSEFTVDLEEEAAAKWQSDAAFAIDAVKALTLSTWRLAEALADMLSGARYLHCGVRFHDVDVFWLTERPTADCLAAQEARILEQLRTP